MGYLESAPADGKALIDDIMSRKSISEFRWTTVEEIVSKGGALVLITKDEYEQWFAKLFSHSKGKDMHRMGILLPGEAMNGVSEIEGSIPVYGRLDGG